MGRRGPVAKPAELRQNRIKRPEIGLVRAPLGEVAPLIPRPPPGLTAASRRRWTTYWTSKVAGAADRQSDLHRVERWIVSVDEYEKVNDVFRKTRLVKGSMGQPVLNPLAAYLAQLRADLAQAENELGLTPLARQRLGLAYGEATLTAIELNRQLDDLDGTDAPALMDIEAIGGDDQEALGS